LISYFLSITGTKGNPNVLEPDTSSDEAIKLELSLEEEDNFVETSGDDKRFEGEVNDQLELQIVTNGNKKGRKIVPIDEEKLNCKFSS
jgi:hypothetical protein